VVEKMTPDQELIENQGLEDLQNAQKNNVLSIKVLNILLTKL